jgi:iron complex outermembrane receptor protein
MFSWRNASSNVGFLLAAAYQQREIRRDGVEVLGYTTDPASGLQVPDLIGSAFFRQDRERQSVNAALQLRPTDRLQLHLNGLYSKFGADNVNANYLAWTSNALGGGGRLTNPTVVGDTAVAGIVSSTPTGRAIVYDYIDRPAEAETQFIDLEANYTAGDTWLLRFDVGYTKAKGITDRQRLIEFGAPGTFRYDLRGNTPSVTFNVDPTAPQALDLDFGNSPTIVNDDDEIYSYLDAEKVLDLPVLKSLKFGVKYTDHERVEDNLSTTFGGFFLPILNGGCGGGPCTPADFFGGLTPGDYLDAIASPGTLDRYWLVNGDTLARVWGAAPYGTRILNPALAFSAEETTYGGFVMANLEGTRWRGNVGLRAVRTDQTSGGNSLGASGEVENLFGNYTPVTAERSYDDYLPSLNFAFDLNPDLVLRVAAARTMARPNYLDVAPSVNLNEGALSGQAGDPDLDPFRANQADVSLEWYRGKDSILSAAVFYKDIDSFITDRLVQRPFLIETNTPNQSRCTPAPTTGAPNRFSCIFDINQRSNGGGGQVTGLELNALQPLGGGFGVQANYTYSDAEADDPGQFIRGNSEHSGNLVAFFENPRVAARAAYSYRSEFLVQFDRSTRLFQESLISLDASVSVKLFRGLSLSLDGVNLTDEEIRQYANDKFRPRAIYNNGRYYFVGLRWGTY